MATIGFATIAQSPRDDVVPGMLEFFPPETRTVERGCLDGLDRAEIATLGPDAEDVGIVARLIDGGSALLSHRKILPIMQRRVDELVREEGADLVVILCGADWTAIECERLVVNPGRVFPGIIGSLAYGRKLGIIKPSAGQIERERERYQAIGIDAVVTSASPYAGEERIALARQAAEELRAAGCDLVWMTCIGMDRAMRDAVADIVERPVILAQSLLAKVTSELIPQAVRVTS